MKVSDLTRGDWFESNGNNYIVWLPSEKSYCTAINTETAETYLFEDAENEEANFITKLTHTNRQKAGEYVFENLEIGTWFIYGIYEIYIKIDSIMAECIWDDRNINPNIGRKACFFGNEDVKVLETYTLECPEADTINI